MRFVPSNWNGLVTTPTVSTPISRAACAITGAAPVPVPPPMPAVMKHMCAPASASTISSIDSSAAAQPTWGLAPAPRPCVTPVPSWMRRDAFDCCSAWASVFAATNSTPSSAWSIMLLTALPPAPPTPKTVMRGRSSVCSGITRSSAMESACMLCAPVVVRGRALPLVRTARVVLRVLVQFYPNRDRRSRGNPASPVVPEPAHRAPEPRASADRRRRLEVPDLVVRAHRIGREAHGRGEARPCRRLRQPADADRPADPHPLAQHPPRHVLEARKLAAAPGQHDAPGGQMVEARGVEQRPRLLQD